MKYLGLHNKPKAAVLAEAYMQTDPEKEQEEEEEKKNEGIQWESVTVSSMA
jgi:hypothetical protein